MSDVLSELGPVFLGSRLKRLGERMQAGAARIIEGSGLPMQPGQMPLLVALDRQPMSIGQLVQAVGISQPGVTRSIGQLIELGLVQSEPGAGDQRQKTVSLTSAGKAAMARAKMFVWPRIEQAVDDLCATGKGAFLEQIARLEAALAAAPLDVRAPHDTRATLRIREFSDELAHHFHDINTEWIDAMFQMEDADREVLNNPRARIVDGGGTILFVEAEGLGIVGTCALQKTGASSFELIKMGVRESARGLKAGEYLLAAMIERASALGADPLYLLTNARCEAAIHLYEKLGFQHDAEIMQRYGLRYARCNVAMRHHTTSAGEAAV